MSIIICPLPPFSIPFYLPSFLYSAFRSLSAFFHFSLFLPSFVPPFLLFLYLPFSIFSYILCYSYFLCLYIPYFFLSFLLIFVLIFFPSFSLLIYFFTINFFSSLLPFFFNHFHPFLCPSLLLTLGSLDRNTPSQPSDECDTIIKRFSPSHFLLKSGELQKACLSLFQANIIQSTTTITTTTASTIEH